MRRKSNTLFLFLFLALVIIVLGFFSLIGWDKFTGATVIEYINITVCGADEDSSNADNFIASCDYSLPSSALLIDDTTYENHSADSLGGTSSFAGLQIKAKNVTISDCRSIENVNLCYLWWADTIQVKNCSIAVDSSGIG